VVDFGKLFNVGAALNDLGDRLCGSGAQVKGFLSR
jgi:hypothetical protein